MDKNDYRNTTYCKKLEKISGKKEELKEIIRTHNHPLTNNFYNIVRNEFKGNYLEIYNYKCAYCGTSVFVLDPDLFEIDHYKNEASCSSTGEAGALENLVVACRSCNRSKGGLRIKDEYLEKLQPDKEEIKKIFYREDDYGIKIKPEYEEDSEILKFYKTLKLDYEFRKLDFLLLNLEGLYESLENGDLKIRIGDLKGRIRKKRSLKNKIIK
ncbi:HNH endonuclease [Fusobacterium ulcerans]|uniref:HNH endonuclease n=1 Tax=Fusobacterium ulcerans TaxID=861 RepID=A0AAX2JAP8_9FUSO|nr:HNH endonuclease [Fusobacterium ulcerans]AVQ29487.1 HNH endonuclease [Fusobacterium ulcerans]EFS27012.1 hypothetical protein FUAG_02527 [Fusobacterium ulcerans ATCC 49185]SQJ03970.1 HNH endonuclease [Fusobacterium ulcerans]